MRKEIAVIETDLSDVVVSEVNPKLTDTSRHLLKAGGKRIRPIFVLLSGKFGDYDLDKLKNVAVALELVHMASLVHDDVIDDAKMRRGQKTVRYQWDNRIAMYTGDYIYGKALEVVTELENPLIHRIFAHAMVQMCIGEMEQVRDFFNMDQSVRHYLLRIRRKTALLIAISCQLGALAVDASEVVAARLYRFGYNVGLAFQIRDDLLDIFGTEKQLGKPPGSDMRQGNLTLPVLAALQEPGIGELLRAEIEGIKREELDTQMALRLIRKSEGVKLAEELADRYIEKAIQALAELPDGQAKKDLTNIAYFVAKRNY
jgi:heptaprenyl diphosphate synthase